MPDLPRCPQCGSRLTADAGSTGLCPSCLLAFVLHEDDSALAAIRIGPYRIVDTLGEGGMGVVYLAEQDEPIRRRVALKVIKLGMDTRDVVTRFGAERQTLALMDHPNIARVIDAGASADGRPYFVMEYVPGLPITEFCDQHRLPTPARLRLFERVCAAVQHAHQRGIIHRDLKPSNVLVAMHEGQPIPKVIDFGIAKAIEHDLFLASRYTEAGRLVGTPEYMSPEQASLGAAAINTQTDVYSLGVLLYELLTGALPFDPTLLRNAGYDEMRRTIREVEPAKPSTRVSDARAKQLRGDLDWITLKALEKDPARRYASASELAADIDRHLRDEPVLASPPGAGYRIRKLIRKHRVAAGVAALFVMLLASAAVVSTVLFLRAESARRDADRRRVQADEAREATEQQRRVADQARIEAGRQRGVAQSQTEVAEAARSDAERQRDAAEQRSYASNIAAADLSLTAGEIREAKRLLDLCAPRLRGWEWGYLRRETDASVATLQGPRAADPQARIQQFDAIRFTRERLFAVGTIGGSLSNANAVAEFVLAGSTPTAAAPSPVPLDPNTSVLAVSGDGRRLLVTRWYGSRPAAGPVLTADGRRSSDGSVELRAENPDLPGDDRNRLFVIDRTSRQVMAVFSLNPVGVWRGRARDVSAIGLRTVSPASRIGQIVDSDLRQPVATVSYPVAVRGVLSDDGSRAAAWSWDNVVHVWDVSSGRALATLAGHEAFIAQAVFTSDSRQLVSGSHDSTVRIWDIESGRTSSVLRLPADLPNQINAIGVSAGRDLIAAGLRNGLIRVWRDAVAVGALQGHRLSVTSFAFDRTGDRLLSASEDRTLRVWDTAGMFELLTLRGHEDAVTGVAFSADGRSIASSSIDGTVRLWNASAPLGALVETNLRVPGVAFLDNGSMIVSGHSDDVVRVWDLASGHVARRTMVPAEISSLAVSPDAQRIAVGLLNRATRTRPQPGVSAVVIDSKTMQTVATLAGQNETVQSVAWSGDGRRLATASDRDNSVRLWDAASGRKISEWKGASSPMRSLAIARDSPPLARLAGSVSPTAAVAFTPDGSRLVSGGGDGLVRLWDVRSGTQLAALPGHDGSVQAVAMSPDGRRIASGGTDRTVRIWSADSDDLLLTMRVNGSVQSLAFSADGERLAAGLLGGTIRVWYSRPR